LVLHLGSHAGRDGFQTRLYKTIHLLRVASDKLNCLRGVIQVEQFAVCKNVFILLHQRAQGCFVMELFVPNEYIRTVDKVDANTRRGFVVVVHFIGRCKLGVGEPMNTRTMTG